MERIAYSEAGLMGSGEDTLGRAPCRKPDVMAKFLCSGEQFSRDAVYGTSASIYSYGPG